ncbi:MAG: T9SS type A sorting domain-containing protein [Candidatus Cloacimonetes bacterium]|nr:T9SS type A sorting domain-containing protein [Candidatus Cloacimonadota bacterium]
MKEIKINRQSFLSWICTVIFILLSYNLMCQDNLDNQTLTIPEEYSVEAETIIKMVKNTEHKSHHQELRENRSLDTELVIITADSLEAVFSELAEIKNEEGIVTEIVTLTTTGATSAAIRSWLATQKTANENLQYVIIGGNKDIVPAHQIVYEHAGSTIYATTDFYYSNVLSTWPQNDNDIMEIDTDVDLYVGRLPVRNSDEVEKYITKYQNFRTNYTDYTDRMSFISTNVHRDTLYYVFDSIVSDIMTQTGDDIICDSLLCPDLVDTLNGAATAVVDMLQDRDYSFLYGVWHGVDQFTILDSEFNHNYPGYWQGFRHHMQSLSINTNRVEGGSCYYALQTGGDHDGEWKYFYTTSDSCYLQLEDVLPQSYGNTYVMWMSSCRTMDMNFVSWSWDFARDANDEIIQNCDETGWLFDYYVETEPDTVYNEENCINEVFFNQTGGPIAIYATSTLDYPNISSYIVKEYMDLQFLDDEHTLGYITNEAWDIFENAFAVYLYRFLFLGYGLFGDPSMDVWSAKAKQLVLSKNITESIYSTYPEFEVYDTSGNPVEALVCVIDDEGVIQGKGMSPYTFNNTIADDWIITANKANYLQDKRDYSYLKSYSTVPYIMDFENGLDKNWRVEVDTTYGRVQVTSANSPYNGNMHLTMDTNTANHLVTNIAELHLNLTGENRLMLDFWWKDINDENHTEDGVFLSDDNGDNFTKVYSLINGSGWENIVIDLDAAIKSAGLEYNKNFIIKFQQRDNYPISSDGFAFDDIQVYSMYAELPYATGFESGFDDYWYAESSNEHGFTEVTTEYITPYEGQKALVMAGDTTGVYVYNKAFLYLNLEDLSDVYLNFWWNDYNDEYHTGDGIYFSDDGGLNFSKAHTLNGATHTNKTWTEVLLDVSDIVEYNASLDMTSQFVVKFQHYDNEIINEDGFAFDKIDVWVDSRGQHGKLKESPKAVIKCYPNPFNPETTLSFNLSENTETNLSIYNIKGQLVRELIKEELDQGNHSVVWDGHDATGKATSSGVYFVRLKTNDQDVTEKIMLIK